MGRFDYFLIDGRMESCPPSLHNGKPCNGVGGGGGGLILPRKLRSNRVKHAIRYLNNQEDCNINEANFYVRNLTFKETVVDYFSNLVLI